MRQADRPVAQAQVCGARGGGTVQDKDRATEAEVLRWVLDDAAQVLLEALRNVREDAPLFDPRRQRWTEHFTVDLESGEIQGMTPTGRATVRCLDLNHPLQITARQLWIRFRLFP